LAWSGDAKADCSSHLSPNPLSRTSQNQEGKLFTAIAVDEAEFNRPDEDHYWRGASTTPTSARSNITTAQNQLGRDRASQAGIANAKARTTTPFETVWLAPELGRCDLAWLSYRGLHSAVAGRREIGASDPPDRYTWDRKSSEVHRHKAGCQSEKPGYLTPWPSLPPALNWQHS
jgi:hypothetical protein